MFIINIVRLWTMKIIFSTLIVGQSLVSIPTYDIIIGGVFTDQDDGIHAQSMESIFKYAVFHYNRLAKDAHNLSSKLRIREETLDIIVDQSAIQTVQDVCSIIGSRRVQGIFGPPYSELATLVYSICYHVNIPFINVCSTCTNVNSLDYDIDLKIEHVSKRNQMSINLYPSNRDLNIAFHSLIHKLNWNKFLIIYDTYSGLHNLQRLLDDPGINQTDILVRQFTHYKDRSVLVDAIGRDIFNIVLDLNDVNTCTVLKLALQMGMINSNYHYVLTTLNIDTYDLEDYKYNFVNLTAFRLFDRNEAQVQVALESFFAFKAISNNEINQRLFTTSVALWVDAILAFAYAYDHLLISLTNHTKSLTRPNVSCAEKRSWPFGLELYSKFHQISFNGITGRIQFTPTGERTGFQLDIVHLSESGLSKIGTWSRERGSNFTVTPMSRGGLFNSTLIVTTVIEAPYVMLKRNQNLTEFFSQNYSNSDFEGFCIDLLDEISMTLKFRYKIKPITTGRYDDMVEEVKNKIADLAIAPLTINYAREKQIDFTKPFLSLGIAILFKLPNPEKPGLFSFLSPLSLEIWMYTFGAVFTVSFVLLFIARCSPDEWHNPYPCDKEYTFLQNRFTVSNTLWFAMGTLMQQGSDISPSAISTRLVSGIWWFFTLILISSYTANLAAFLTVEKVVNPIESADDLAKQTKVKYGVLEGGSTEQFFRESSIPTYQAMWKYMSNNPDVFVKKNQDGIDRVKVESYAFLMESTSIEYIIQRECNLTQVGGLLDNKGYGIGLPEGSPYRERFSEIILDLQEKGVIQRSYNKWWKGKGTCSSEKKDSKANPLGVSNIGGIFLVLLGGVFLSFIVAILEFLWHARKNHPNRQHSIWWELTKELRFAVQCDSSNRKALIGRRCSQCVSDHNKITRNPIEIRNHRRSKSNPSTSLTIDNGITLRPLQYRSTIEQTTDGDKFDTLLMLAAESTKPVDRKNYLLTSLRRKTNPLLLIEQDTLKHDQNIELSSNNYQDEQIDCYDSSDSSSSISRRLSFDESKL